MGSNKLLNYSSQVFFFSSSAILDLFFHSTPCPNYTCRDNISASSNLGVHTRRDVTESIKYHSQSEACVGRLSLDALCTHNEMD